MLLISFCIEKRIILCPLSSTFLPSRIMYTHYNLYVPNSLAAVVSQRVQ
jgi:hypothetical protein